MAKPDVREIEEYLDRHPYPTRSELEVYNLLPPKTRVEEALDKLKVLRKKRLHITPKLQAVGRASTIAQKLGMHWWSIERTLWILRERGKIITRSGKEIKVNFYKDGRTRRWYRIGPKFRL